MVSIERYTEKRGQGPRGPKFEFELGNPTSILTLLYYQLTCIVHTKTCYISSDQLKIINRIEQISYWCVLGAMEIVSWRSNLPV